MSHARHRLRTLGLCLIAVLGLTAFMVGSAQAQWLLLGTETLSSKTLTGHQSVQAAVHQLGKFAVPTLAGGFEVECKKVHLTEGLLLGTELKPPAQPATHEPNIAHAILDFLECLTFTEKVARPLCNPVNGLVEAKTLVLPILHPAGTVKLLFEPPPGEEAFAVINIPASCALPLKNKVTGALVAECLKETDLALLTCSKEQKNQLLRQIPHALGLAIGDTLKYGNHAATLGGVVGVFMTGAHENGTFGVDAP